MAVNAIWAKACSRLWRRSTVRSWKPLADLDAENQILIDKTMIELDGTPEQGQIMERTRFWVCRLLLPRQPPMLPACRSNRYIGGPNAHVMPVPMMNIINGGEHADKPD